MTYAVKEMFFTFQGEGAKTGTPSVFVRFAGCNLWSGLSKDRAKAVCQFCDTDFVGTDGVNGGKFKTAEALAKKAKALWPLSEANEPLAVFTGGEPLLQLDKPLIEAFHHEGFAIAVESNGTVKASKGIDWLTVSPKAAAPLKQKSGDELKLVFPQAENRPEDFESLDFKVFSLQPKDDPNLKKNLALCIAYCASHPKWRLSLQAHKIWDID